jgi:alpha-tubulin suppressor-like RCC1 family protein
VTPSIVYISGGPGLVARSIDGGVHWSKRNAGIAAPTSNCAFIALAISKTAPTTLYASVGTSCNGASPVALYKTSNGGFSWTPVSTAPDYTGNGYAYGSGTGEQGAYDNVLAIDPRNVNHVLAGGETVVESTDGGTTWTNVNGVPFRGHSNPNPLHPDQHALWFAPNGSMLIGNDGGIYRYGSGQVTNLNFGLNITQFYPGMTETGPYPNILGGTQDNSTTVGGPQEVPCQSSGTLCSLQPGLTIPLDWLWGGIDTGDGGPTAQWVDSSNNMHTLYESDQNLYLTTNWTSKQAITPIPCTVNGCPNAPFTPPMIAVPNPADSSNPTVFYGANDLWRTTNPSASPPTWTQVTSVGKGVSAVVAASNGNVIYVGFTDGTVQVSTDGGATFNSLAAQPFPKPDTTVTGLSVDPTNPQSITASFAYGVTRSASSGLDNPHVAQYTYTTSPGSGTWSIVTGDLPANIGVSRVIYDNGALVAGTDSGVYATDAPNGASTVWSRVGLDMPNVQVEDLVYDPVRKGLLAVTHGRGAWQLLPSVIGAAVAGYPGDGEYGAGDGIPQSGLPVLAKTPIGVKVTAVAAGDNSELALLKNGNLMAWGNNSRGQLGNGTNTNSSLPVKVKLSLSAGVTVTAIAGGSSDSFALLSNGSVLGWGYNGSGQLGNGTNTDSNVPVPVSLPAGATAKAIASDNGTSMALMSDGSVFAWGENVGSPPFSPSNVPVRVSLPAGSTATAIAVGSFHSLAVLSDGSVYAWGDNTYGQLGDGTNNNSNLPVKVQLPAGTAAKAVAAGGYFSLALLTNGNVLAWGNNFYGQLGNGTNTDSNVPVQTTIPAGDTVQAIAAGGYTAYALLSDRSTLAWGNNNSYFEFGNEDPTSNVPVTGCPASCYVLAIDAKNLDTIMVVDMVLAP